MKEQLKKRKDQVKVKAIENKDALQLLGTAYQGLLAAAIILLFIAH